MSKLVLFDIDGTLVLTGGAGMRAMDRALEAVLGMRAAMTGVPLAGRTDWSILQDAIRPAGHELDDRLLKEIRDEYVKALGEEILKPGHGPKAVMPGIRELLDALHARPDVFLGLLTGNFAEGARIKLEYFDLWRYFRCGAYGDDAADRNALVPVALERAAECGLNGVPADRIFVVGDTPNDVACAHAAGARAVAVATGSYTVDQLRETGASDVFRDLSDARAFLTLL